MRLGSASGRAVNLSLAAILALGITLRLWHYLARPSLWIDEARLGLNVGARGLAGLLRPLDYDQVAPPLFLLAEKAATGLLGMNELALRLLPLMAGVALLFLLRSLARQLLSPAETVVVLVVAAVCPVLVYFSNEVKPYTVDAAATAGMVLLARDAAARPSGRKVLVLAGGGVLAIWLSTPAVFVLSGIAIAWLVSRRRVGVSAAQALAVGLAWLLSFAVAYALVYRADAASPYLREFWSYRLLDPMRPAWLTRVWFALREAIVGLLTGTASGRGLSALWSHLSHVLTALALLLIVFGAARMLRRRGPFDAALMAGPLAAAFGASLLGLYPIALRVTLFAAPLVLVLVVAGATAILEHATPGIRPFAALVLLCSLGFLPYFAVLGALDPAGWEHGRPLISELARRARAGDAIYVDAGSLPAWVFYTTDWKTPDQRRLGFAARIGSSGGPSFENAAPRRRAIVAEGDSLTYEGPFGPEIYGLFTGMQWRWGVGLVQSAPDSGWATNEVRRMARGPGTAWWVLFLHDFGSSAALRQALEDSGARATFTRNDGLVQLFRYERQVSERR